MFREKKLCTAYRGSDFSSIKPNGSVEDVATGGDIYTYSLDDSKKHNFQAEINVAFIFHGNNIKVGDVKFNSPHGIIIKNNEIKEVVSYCTSSEGVHVISRYGGVHLYYSLGYEVEANCLDEVYK